MSLSTLYKVITGVLSLLGVLSIAKDWYNFETPHNPKQILYSQVGNVVYLPNRYFSSSLELAGNPGIRDPVLQTDFVIWRQDGDPLTREMTRSPLVIQSPVGSHLIAVQKKDGTDPAVDGIAVMKKGDSVEVSWNVFDPNVSVELAILRSGNFSPLIVSGNIGPGIQVAQPDQVRNQVLAISTGLLTFAMFGGMAGLIFYSSTREIRRLTGENRKFSRDQWTIIFIFTFSSIVMSSVAYVLTAKLTEPAAPIIERGSGSSSSW